jgi:hypothetical protein
LRAQRGGFGGQRREGAVPGHFGDDGTQAGEPGRLTPPPAPPGSP